MRIDVTDLGFVASDLERLAVLLDDDALSLAESDERIELTWHTDERADVRALHEAAEQIVQTRPAPPRRGPPPEVVAAKERLRGLKLSTAEYARLGPLERMQALEDFFTVLALG